MVRGNIRGKIMCRVRVKGSIRVRGRISRIGG